MVENKRQQILNELNKLIYKQQQYDKITLRTKYKKFLDYYITNDTFIIDNTQHRYNPYNEKFYIKSWPIPLPVSCPIPKFASFLNQLGKIMIF